MVNQKSKKLFPLIIFSIFIYFSAIPETQDILFLKNHLTSQDFPSKDIKNLIIKTTYENIEFSEIYGTEIAIDIYGNNNTLLPEISLKNDTLTIESSVITKIKKSTPGDNCKIIIYLPKDIWLENLVILYAPELFITEKSSQEKNTPETNSSHNETFIIPEIKALNTSIETINANITGKNLTGSLIIKTKNGNINLENITPRQISKTTKTTQDEIQLYATTNTGTITLSNFKGHYLSLKTSSSITARNIAPEIFEIKSSEGTVAITMRTIPLATSKIITKTGNIQLFMPTNASFTINIASPRGTFIDKIQPQRKNRPHNITKIYNKGGPSINLETTTGTIELESF